MGALHTSAHQPSVLPPKLLDSIKSRGLVVACAIYVSGLTTLVAFEYFPIEADWELMRFQQARIGNSEATEPPNVLLLTGHQQFLRFSRSEARPGMSEQELETMRANSERFAYAAPMFKYALAQALNHQPGNGLMTLKKMCSMQPVSICLNAKTEWERLARSTYPELVPFSFPIQSTKSMAK